MKKMWNRHTQGIMAGILFVGFGFFEGWLITKPDIPIIVIILGIIAMFFMVVACYFSHSAMYYTGRISIFEEDIERLKELKKTLEEGYSGIQSN